MTDPNDLSLQLANLKDALEKQQRLLVSDAAVTELCSMFRVETVDALVPAVKERLSTLYSEIERARRDKEEGINNERKQYDHFRDGYNTLRSELVQVKDVLRSAQLRVDILEAQERLRQSEVL